jgi:putative transposase
LRIIGVARSIYYYHVSKKGTERAASGGRPVPGYSYTTDKDKVSDTRIKEWLLQLIEYFRLPAAA